METTTTCPRCGSGDVLPILYGMPGPEMVEDSAAGKVALAHGGQPWQDATIFDGVVLSTGGPDFYRQAFIDLDPEALGSDTMVQAFDRMTQLRGFVDDNFSGRDWNLASVLSRGSHLRGSRS